jgi:hypothetical protein
MMIRSKRNWGNGRCPAQDLMDFLEGRRAISVVEVDGSLRRRSRRIEVCECHDG